VNGHDGAPVNVTSHPEVALVEKPVKTEGNLAAGTWEPEYLETYFPFPGNLANSHKFTLYRKFRNLWQSTIEAT
jgi:hypothetical protein